MKRLIFNPEITWGHIMQLVVMLLALATLYADARVYKEQTEHRIKRLEENDAVLTARVTEQVQHTQRLSDAVLRLTTMLDERERFGARGKAFN